MGNIVSKRFKKNENTQNTSNTSTSVQNIDELISKFMKNELINNRFIPDFIEKNIYSNITKVIVGILQETLRNTKIETLGHTITFNLVPIPITQNHGEKIDLKLNKDIDISEFQIDNMSSSCMKVELAHPFAKAPIRSSEGAAGYDLFACEPAIIEGFGVKMVNTGIKIQIPENTYARIAPRSSMSVKGIAVGAGVVDYDYRGIVQVIFYNHSKIDYEIKRGDKIAQIILEKIETPEVLIVDSLNNTDRGDGGFGSTGR